MKKIVLNNLTIPQAMYKYFFLLLMGFLFMEMPVSAQNRSNLKMANEYYEAFEYSKAVEYYRKVLTKSKKNKEAILNISDSYRMLNDYDKAAIWYKKAVDVEPKNHLLKYYYAQALMSTGNYDEAQVLFSEYSQLVPQDSRPQRAIEWCENIDFYVSDSSDFKIELLPMNSRYSDFGPTFYKDGIVFASGRPIKNNEKASGSTGESYLDLFVTFQSGPDTWSMAKELTGKEQSKFHEGPVSFTKDYIKMYLTRNINNRMKKGKVATLKIYEFTNKNGKWENRIELPFNSAKDDYSVAHPAISADGQTLYFTSDKIGGYGGKDLYKSVKQGNDWSAPQNLGPTINTEGDEVFPFVHSDGTLYFASNGFGGFGGLDVFFSNQENNEWSKPMNIGYPVNSPQDDFGLILNDDKKRGYISSNRKRGKGGDDIYLVMIEDQKAAELLVGKESSELNYQEDITVSIENVNLSQSSTKVKKDKDSRYYIVGKVLDYGTLDEFKDANIEILELGNKETISDKTDANGNFYFQVYEGKEYLVFCRNEEGYVEEYESVMVDPSQLKTKTINVYLKCKKTEDLAKEVHKNFMSTYENDLPQNFQPSSRKIRSFAEQENLPRDTFQIIPSERKGIPILPKTETNPIEEMGILEEDSLEEEIQEEITLPIFNEAKIVETVEEKTELVEEKIMNEPYEEITVPTVEEELEETKTTVVINRQARIDNTVQPTLDIMYKVQVAALSRHLPTTHPFLRVVKEEYLVEFANNGNFRYVVGNYTDLTNASNYQNYLKQNGYPDAYIVIYLNGERQELGVDQAPNEWLIYR